MNVILLYHLQIYNVWKIPELKRQEEKFLPVYFRHAHGQKRNYEGKYPDKSFIIDTLRTCRMHLMRHPW